MRGDTKNENPQIAQMTQIIYLRNLCHLWIASQEVYGGSNDFPKE